MSLYRAAAWVLRLGLGGLLAWSGFAKLGDPHTFAWQIANYRMLPPQANQALAVTLPWIELLAGLLIVLGLWLRPAALAAAGLMLVFLAAVGSALARGLDIDCACFGGFAVAKAGWSTLALEAALLAAAVAIYLLGRKDENKTV